MSTKGYKETCAESKYKLDKLMATQATCDWIPLTGSTLGEGTQGYTVQVCCNGNCLFVAKIMKGKSRERIVQEMTMQYEFANIGSGIAPALVDAWSCGNEAFLVMEKVDTSVDAYVQKLANDTSVSMNVINATLDFVQDKVQRMVAAAHRHKLVHNDLNMGNVMLNLNDAGMPESVKLIDFGASYKVGSQEEADRAEKTVGIEQSINLMRSQANDIRKFVLSSGMKWKPTPAVSTKRKAAIERTSATPVRIAQPMFDDEEEEKSIPFAMRLDEVADEPMMIPSPIQPQELQSQGYKPLIRPTFIDDDEQPSTQRSFRAPPSAPKKGRRLF